MSNETTTVPGEFKIPQERIIHGTPDQVWQAVTHPGGWLWPMEYEPREGASAPSAAPSPPGTRPGTW